MTFLSGGDTVDGARTVSRVTLHEGSEATQDSAGAVVLGAGLAGSADIATAVREYGSAGAVALIVKEPLDFDGLVEKAVADTDRRTPRNGQGCKLAAKRVVDQRDPRIRQQRGPHVGRRRRPVRSCQLDRSGIRTARSPSRISRAGSSRSRRIKPSATKHVSRVSSDIKCRSTIPIGSGQWGISTRSTALPCRYFYRVSGRASGPASACEYMRHRRSSVRSG